MPVGDSRRGGKELDGGAWFPALDKWKLPPGNDWADPFSEVKWPITPVRTGAMASGEMLGKVAERASVAGADLTAAPADAPPLEARVWDLVSTASIRDAIELHVAHQPAVVRSASCHAFSRLASGEAGAEAPAAPGAWAEILDEELGLPATQELSVATHGEQWTLYHVAWRRTSLWDGIPPVPVYRSLEISDVQVTDSDGASFMAGRVFRYLQGDSRHPMDGEPYTEVCCYRYRYQVAKATQMSFFRYDVELPSGVEPLDHMQWLALRAEKGLTRWWIGVTSEPVQWRADGLTVAQARERFLILRERIRSGGT